MFFWKTEIIDVRLRLTLTRQPKHPSATTKIKEPGSNCLEPGSAWHLSVTKLKEL